MSRIIQVTPEHLGQSVYGSDAYDTGLPLHIDQVKEICRLALAQLAVSALAGDEIHIKLSDDSMFDMVIVNKENRKS